MSSQLVGIADRYDRELAGVTDETLKRIFAAYDTSYRNLVKNLREAFPRLEQAGSISTLVRQGAIAAELGEALKFINPEAAKELERLGRDTIQQAGDLGQQMAGDALKYVGVQSTFTTVPVGVVRNQAERFRERLVNYSDQQASSISAVVEQGLIQGWGTRKIEGQLRGLGVSFKSNAETVARTETLSAYNGAARSRYEQAGVSYIQWIATPAEGTCSLCYARNTKVWKITEAPSIPAHPRCRCATLPVSSLDQIDTAFYESYSQDGLDDLARQKLQPDNGLTYWEKKAGATLAKPAWVPGQVIPKAEPLTANSLKWTRPANIPAKAKLQVVDIEQVWKDYQENGITLDLSDPATRARVDRLKADILNAVESGGKFTAPKLTFAKAGNEFNIPPGFDVTDGRHRITAFKELGFTSVKAYVDGDKPTATAKPAAAKAQPQITPKPYMVNDMYAAEGKLIQRVKEHERAIYEINRSKKTSFTVDGKTLTKQEALDLATAAMKKAKQEALKSSLDTLERLAQKKKNDPDNFGYAADIGESSGRDSQHDWLQPKLTAVPPAVEFNIKKQTITVDDNDGNYAEIKIVDPKVFAALYKKYQPIIQEMDVDARREINAESRLDDLARIQGTTREIAQQRIQSIQEFSVFEYSGIRAADAGKTTFWDVEKDKERQVTDEHRQHARRINDYIESSPKYDGVVYRGFRQDTGDAGSYVEKIKAALKSDDGYSLRSVSSFSSDFEVAKEFAAKSGDGKKPPPEVFLIEVKRNTRGASIRSVSEIPMEAEVLVPNGTRYRYVGERVVIGSVANAALTTKGPTGRIVIYEVEEF